VGVVDIFYLLEKKRIKIIMLNLFMYLMEDVWGIIKSYMYHNIKIHGKHLKNDPYIIQYNQVIKNIPKPTVPINGPRIIFTSAKKNIRFIRFIYHLDVFFLWKRTIVEHQLLNEDYDEDCMTHDSLYRQEYFNQYTI
jgi:hypothetical protein